MVGGVRMTFKFYEEKAEREIFLPPRKLEEEVKQYLSESDDLQYISSFVDERVVEARVCVSARVKRAFTDEVLEDLQRIARAFNAYVEFVIYRSGRAEFEFVIKR
jgi:hypothetical protein